MARLCPEEFVKIVTPKEKTAREKVLPALKENAPTPTSKHAVGESNDRGTSYLIKSRTKVGKPPSNRRLYTCKRKGRRETGAALQFVTLKELRYSVGTQRSLPRSQTALEESRSEDLASVSPTPDM